MGGCTCAAKISKQQYLWAWCQSVLPNDAPRNLGSEVAFGAKFQIPVAREGGKCRPLDHTRQIPFVHSARSIIGNNSYIYSSILVICGTFKCILRWCLFDDCPCALAEIVLFFRAIVSPVFFHMVSAGAYCHKIHNIHTCAGEQGWRIGESTRLPPMWLGIDSRPRRNM